MLVSDGQRVVTVGLLPHPPVKKTVTWYVQEGLQYPPVADIAALEKSLDHDAPPVFIVHQFFRNSLESSSSITEVKKMLGTNRLINLYDLTLHCLTADIYGHSFIAEAGEEANELTGTDENWIVMTNFKVSDFRDTEVEEIEGVGDVRYRTALDYIESHCRGFGYTEALATLEAAKNTDAVWGTKASMVLDPTERIVYICLSGDFNRVWKLSIDNSTIETFSGFDITRSEYLSSEGLTATELRLWQ